MMQKKLKIYLLLENIFKTINKFRINNPRKINQKSCG